MEVCGCTWVEMLSVFKLVHGERFFLSLLLLAWYIFNSMCKCVCLCACVGVARAMKGFFFLVLRYIFSPHLHNEHEYYAVFLWLIFFFFCLGLHFSLFAPEESELWECESTQVFGTGNVSVELLAHSRAELYNLVYRSAILGSSSERKRL